MFSAMCVAQHPRTALYLCKAHHLTGQAAQATNFVFSDRSDPQASKFMKFGGETLAAFLAKHRRDTSIGCAAKPTAAHLSGGLRSVC